MLSKDDDYFQSKGKFLLELYRKALTLSEKELYNYFIDHAVNITKSEIGFFHFVNSDQQTIALSTWNKEALKTCTANYSDHYPLEEAGNWADCVRLKKPVIYNNFLKSPNQKGLPKGHVAIKRMLSIPIIEDNKVQVIFGVGNKTEPYDEQDIIQLELVANELNKIIKQRQLDTKLRESEERFSKAFHGSPVAMAITRLDDGMFVDVNPSFSQLLGYSHEEVVGKKTTDLDIYTNPADRIQIIDMLSKQGRVCNYELEFRTKAGKHLKLLFFTEITNLNSQDHLITSAIDITESHQAQQKLEEYADNLERLIEERTKQLKNAERLAVIGETAGMVGHDLRNPLQSITFELYFAKNKVNQEVPDGQLKNTMLKSIESIEAQVIYMDKIVSDLQTFVKPVKIYKQKINLKKIIASTLAQVIIPNDIQTYIQIEENLMVEADPQLLKRVLINLVTNAVQAMPKGGELTIKAYADCEGLVQVDVKDTGIGISEEIKSKVFTPLFTTKAKGQGFGLAVCKLAIEAQGGTITFESEIGKGTTFMVHLPRRDGQ